MDLPDEKTKKIYQAHALEWSIDIISSNVFGDYCRNYLYSDNDTFIGAK